MGYDFTAWRPPEQGVEGAEHERRYTYDPNTGRMTEYQFTLAWNANGSLKQLAITDNISDTADTQACGYAHDDLGRIASVSCGSAWSQTFGYDSDGNLEDDPITGNPNSFDAEGKAVKLENVAVTFDALGRAVEAAESGGTIEFLYGPGGSKLAVMSGQTLKRADIPLPTGGEAVYTSSGLAYYRHADHLGSSRLASSTSRTLYSSTAYAPYGEAYDQAGTADKSFTGQKQDINSTSSGGQYDFLMREQNPIQGRWWTPDPAGFSAVNPANPQSWNRYAYVGGIPMSLVDPTGLEACASVQLDRSGKGENAQASGDNFGPYDPGADDAAAAAQSGNGCNPPVCTIDGTEVDCGWVEAEMGWGLPGGGAATEIGACLWGDCMGSEGSNGLQQTPVWTDIGGPGPLVQLNNGSWAYSSDPDWGYQWQTLPTEQGCGFDPFCWAFSGFVNLTLNNQPSGALQLAGGELGVGAAVAAGAAYGPATLDAVSQLPELARLSVLNVYTNPELIEALGQFVDGFNPLGAVPSTRLGWVGLGLGTAYTVYDMWDQIWGN